MSCCLMLLLPPLLMVSNTMNAADWGEVACTRNFIQALKLAKCPLDAEVLPLISDNRASAAPDWDVHMRFVPSTTRKSH